jgi:hypothetical protein
MVAFTDEQGTRMRVCTHGQTSPGSAIKNY